MKESHKKSRNPMWQLQPKNASRNLEASSFSQEIASQCLWWSWYVQHATRRGRYIEALGARKAQRME